MLTHQHPASGCACVCEVSAEEGWPGRVRADQMMEGSWLASDDGCLMMRWSWLVSAPTTMHHTRITLLEDQTGEVWILRSKWDGQY